MLVEAARRGGVGRRRDPGPLGAFYECVRSRRGMQIAVVATARKLAVLCWHLLSRGSAGPWFTVVRSDPSRRGGERGGRLLGARGGRRAGRVRGRRSEWSAGARAGRVPARSG